MLATVSRAIPKARTSVRSRVMGLNWNSVMTDMQPFLALGAGADLLTRENLLKVLSRS
jgi:hypothetical protein